MMFYRHIFYVIFEIISKYIYVPIGDKTKFIM